MEHRSTYRNRLDGYGSLHPHGGRAGNEDKRRDYEKRDLRDGRVCSINASTLQRFNASTLQTRGLFCFDPASVLRLYCLALTFVFFGTVGAMAQTVANAGPDQEVASGATVTLDGSGSMDSGGSILGYRWIIGSVSASHVPGFGTKDGKVVSFTAPILDPGAEDVEIFFSLLVTGSVGGTDKDTVTITVEAPNAPPVACGNGGTIPYGATIASGANYTLDASCSTDPDGDEEIDTYIWRYPAGHNGETDKAAGLTERADVLAPGAPDKTLVYTLTVVDVHDARSEPVTVTFIVTSPIKAPNAVAVTAESEYASGATVTLDGSGSSVDRRRGPIAYTWARTSGTGGSVTLSDPSAEQPTFTADTLEAGAQDVTHTFTLTVTDSDNKTDTDTVEITVEAPNAPPVADAGPDQVVASGALLITLDGSGSKDNDGTISSYRWTFHDGITGDTTIYQAANSFLYRHADTLVPGVADVTHEFTLVVTDNEGAQSEPDTMKLTVEAPFADPVADAGDDRTFGSGETVTLDGSGSTVDRRRSLDYSWTRTSGTGGPVTLSDASAEQPTFTADTLAIGAADVTHEFTLTVTDDVGKTDTDTVTVTVNLPNAPPVADAGPDQVVASGALLITLDGSGSKDNDGTISSYRWTFHDGITGDTTIYQAANSFLYRNADTLVPGAADVTHEFTLVVTDNEGAQSEPDTMKLTVEAPFADPVADAGDDRTFGSGETVTLDGSGSTVDRRRSLDYSWTRTSGTGGPVTLSDASAEQPTFTADTLAIGAADVTHEFTLTVTDDVGKTDTDTVTVTVNLPNAPPVADAGPDQVVASGALLITLDGSGSKDNDGTISSYRWTFHDGITGDTTIYQAANSFLYRHADTLVPGAADVTHEFTLVVTDNEGAQSEPDTMKLTVEAPFADPVADAGDDRTFGSGETVTLDGSGSTVDRRRSLDYSWTRTGGTGGPVTLSDASAAQPTFRADTLAIGAADVTHVFELTVTDDMGKTDTDTVTVTVNLPNAPPVADAGPDQVVASGALLITLDGSGSKDNDGTISSYRWTFHDGITGDTTIYQAANSFLYRHADTLVPGAADVTHEFTLVVTDNEGAQSEPDTMKLTVEAPFADPVADAGDDRTFGSGETVTLDGSGSTVDRRRSLDYSWTRTSGTGGPVTLSDASAEQPTFTADTLAIGAADVTHEFTLTVTDDVGKTDTDTVTVTVNLPNAPPVADAGPDQVVASGALLITLDGSGSKDNDGTISSYRWTFHDGITGDTTIYQAANSFLYRHADTLVPGAADVTHEFTLVVTDNEGAQSEPDTMKLTVEAPFADPVADAGDDRTFGSGETVTLDGSGSTVDRRRSLDYSWTRTSGTGGPVTLSDASAAQPTFRADTLAIGAADVTHDFTLTVTDDVGETSTDTVTVTVEAPNAPPIADAGPDQVVASGATVELDGSGSRDNDGTIVSYQWRLRSGITGATTFVSGRAQPSLTLGTLVPGAADVTHEIILVVTDNEGAESEVNTVTVTVEAPFAAPMADAGDDRTFGSGETVTLDGSGSTVDRRRTISSYAWSRTDGTGGPVTLSSMGAEQPTFTADTVPDGAADVTHVFSLTVTDDVGKTDTDTVTITVTSGFADPVAMIAGGDRELASGATVQLDGSVSTHDSRTTLTYSWARTGGTSLVTGTLADAMTAKPSFTAETLTDGDPDVTHILTLTVTDGESVTDTAMVTITVTSGFVAPDAIITGGNRELASGATVELDGSGSTHDSRTTLTYSWVRTGGTSTATGTLTDATTAKPSFTAETLTDGADDVTHILTLTVTDGESVTDTAMVTITVTSGFAAPDAIIAGGNRELASGATVELDGSGSTHDDRTTLTYSWARAGGTSLVTGTLADAMTAKPSFTAETLTDGDPDVTHILTLTVTDGESVTDTAMVTITVTSGFAAPDAIIAGGNRDLASGATVELDGSVSTHDSRTTVTYSWARTGGTSTATGTLTGATTAKPSFTAETLTDGAEDVTHILTLTVTDSEGGTDTATVTITVEATVEAPIADAGPDQVVASGATVELDGSGSRDNDGTIVSYQWRLRSGITGATTFVSGRAQPSLTLGTLVPGAADVTHEIILVVTDNEGAESEPDTMTVTVTAPFAELVADAGDPQTVAPGATVTLDGSGSTPDRRRTIATYAWTRTSGTGGSLTDRDKAMASFTAPALTPGAPDAPHVFTLTVTDDAGDTETDTVTITVTSPFAPVVADAGDDQSVASGATVTLDGSGSTHDRRYPIGEYAWKRTGGTTGGSVTLSDENAAKPTFTADALTNGASSVKHIFTLTVTDSDGETDTDTVTVVVVAPDPTDMVAPTVVFREVPTSHDGETAFHVELKFSEPVIGSLAEVIFGSYLDAPSGTPGPLATNLVQDPNDPTLYTVTITPRAPYSFFLVLSTLGEGGVLLVTDAGGNGITGSTNSGQIRYVPPKRPPEADAGDDRVVFSGETVRLDASRTSDFDDLVVGWLWENTGDGTSTARPTITNADKEQASFVAETLTAGSPDVTHIIKLTVTDQADNTDTDFVTITVREPFADPVAHAGPDQLAVVSGTTVQLDGSGSSVDRRRTATYAWARTGGTTGGSVTLSPSATVQNPTFTADALVAGDSDVTHEFTLTVMDNDGGAPATDMVTITVTAPPAQNRPPVACGNGGTIPYGATIASGATYTLDASCSTDPDGDEELDTYIWRYPSGFSDETDKAAGLTERADVLAPGAPDKTLVYTLTVVDFHDARSEPVTVTFTVTAPFAPTVANAGADREVVSGTVGVELDGSGSTYDRRFPIEEYKWEWTSGTGGATEPSSLTNADMAKATFTADTLMVGDPDVTHTFTLTVTDSDGDKSTDTVTITVTPPAAPRVADAGPDQMVAAGATVTLDGSGSTVVDGPISAYNWTRESGTSTRTTIFATDSGGTTNQREISTPTITFVADNVPANGAAVTHVIALRVFDADGIPSPKDEVTVTVNPNQLPTANAGVDRSVDSGVTVMLVGSGTDSDSDDATLTYSWAWTSGSGASVPLTDADKATASFTANTLTPGAADATHTFTLTVTDNNGESAMGTVTITVEAPLAPLVADAGEPQTVESGDPVTLDGSGSTATDSDRTVTYAWERTSGTSTATVMLIDADTTTPDFTAEVLAEGADDVTHTFTLTVTDDQDSTEATDTVTVTIEAPDAVADTTAPTGVIKPVATTHDGMTAITMTVDFDEPVTGFVASDITATITLPAGFPLETHGPTITNFAEDTNDASLYTFTLTPRAPLLISLSVAADAFSDEAGNPGKAGLSLQVSYTGANAAPIADAGMDQEVAPGETVTLDGRESRDIDGSIKSYAWFHGGTGQPELTGGTTARPSFTAPDVAPGAADRVLSYGLSVTDNQDRAGDRTDTVRITVIAPIAPTVAEAGPNQTVASGALVELDGSGSTSDRRFPIGENN